MLQAADTTDVIGEKVEVEKNMAAGDKVEENGGIKKRYNYNTIIMVYVFIHPVIVIILYYYFKSFTGLTFFLKRFNHLRTAFISERMVITL